MVGEISKEQFNLLQKKIGAELNGTNRLFVQINETIGAVMEYFMDTGTFDLDILEMPLNDDRKGIATYSHGYPPCLVPTVVRLLKQYVKEYGDNFDRIREYEARSKKGFADYFEAKTGIPYHDLVEFEPY